MTSNSRTRPSNEVSSTSAEESCEMSLLSDNSVKPRSDRWIRAASAAPPSASRLHSRMFAAVEGRPVPSSCELFEMRARGLAPLHHQLLDLGDRLGRVETLRA